MSTTARNKHAGPHTAAADPIVFSAFVLDRRGGRLTRGGETIPLRPKTWSVLLYLAERPGVLVTKDELLDAVWPDIAVTPDTLTKSIGELRQALVDDSRTPRYIETAHRRGFRFIAKTQVPGSRFPVPGSGSPVPGSRSPVPGSGSPVSGLEKDELETRDQEPRTGVVVGRAAELRRLEALFAKACAGQRQIVFVTGAAGVGKTTLVEAFLNSTAVRQAALPVWIGRGCCIDQHGTREACMCVLDALERLVRRPGADRLLELLRRSAPTWLVQMPWLVDDADALQESLQAARSERMLREFVALTEAFTSDVTLVLALEDLHWSDPSTVDLLSLLGQRREPARLLVIATYRPAEVAVHEHVLSQAVRTLQVRRQCVELPVNELTLADLQSYLEARFPGSGFPPALAPVLHHHTDGHPLFMVAMIEHMLSRAWILDTAPGWALSASLEKIELGVPDDVRRMIETQFEGLIPADRDLLEAASVGGVRFAPQAIAAALGWETSETEMRCERLARAHRFLRVAGAAEWPDGSATRRYAFAHEVYRQAVYADIPDGRRQRLHQRIGETLEAAYGERAPEIGAMLAVHFEQSHDYPRTVRYLGAALTVAARLPDRVDRRRRELELRLALTSPLSDLHGFAAELVGENCERARELCAEVGSPDQLFQILYVWCHFHQVRADNTLAAETEAQLDDLARRLGTTEHRLLAETVLVRNAVHRAHFVEACRLAEDGFLAAHHATTPPLPFAYGADPVIAATCHYALALWFLGHRERAGTTMQAALAAARGTDSPFTLAAALGHTCILEVLCRNAATVGDSAEELVSLSTEQGFVYWNAIASACRGWARVERGQMAKGIAELESALAALRATRALLFSSHILAFLAEAHLRAGTFAAGLTAVDEGLAVAESTLDRSYWPELWRLKGELVLASALSSPRQRGKRRREGASGSTLDHHWREAEPCLLRAVELSSASEATSLELRAATSLARAWHARGRRADARRLLAGVCRWFGTSNGGADLMDARSLLDELYTSPQGRHSPARRPVNRTR